MCTDRRTRCAGRTGPPVASGGWGGRGCAVLGAGRGPPRRHLLSRPPSRIPVPHPRPRRPTGQATLRSVPPCPSRGPGGGQGSPGLGGDRIAPATPPQGRSRAGNLGRCHSRVFGRREHSDAVAIEHDRRGGWSASGDSAELCRFAGTNLVTAIATFPEPPGPVCDSPGVGWGSRGRSPHSGTPAGSGDCPAGAVRADLGEFGGFFSPLERWKSSAQRVKPGKV